ncbi:hypothetical protein Tco_1325459 [Tanacetum coccineum]
MLVEMVDMTKKGTYENSGKCPCKIDKFVLSFDFVVIDMLGDPNETMILGRKGKTKMVEPGTAMIRYGNNKIDDINREKIYNEWFTYNNKHLNHYPGYIRGYTPTMLQPYDRSYAIVWPDKAKPELHEDPALKLNSYFLDFT